MSHLDLFAPGSVRVTGELSERLLLNFDRLEREDYRPKRESAKALAAYYQGGAYSAGWPGDWIGRLILAFSHLERVTDRRPQNLEEILEHLAEQLNEKGYFGEMDTGFDEQQLSGHGWLVAGLIQHWKLTGDKNSLGVAVRMAEGLFLPLAGQMSTYPTQPESRAMAGEKVGAIAGEVGQWKLSSDIGCAFIGLEAVVRVAEATGREDFKAVADEMFAVFASIDLIKISAQLHASLTAARMFLQFHEACGRPEMLRTARRTYELFRTVGITENYANYNWFRRPTWTEPCAIVDAMLLAISLHRLTGEPGYLNDAHSIYFNAIGFAQRPNGGFASGNCVGAEATYLEPGTDGYVCCNMRGAVGLSELVDNIYLRQGEDLTVAWYFPGSAELKFSDGTMRIEQTTSYPEEGELTLCIKETSCNGAKTIRLFIPTWVDWDKTSLEVNGEKIRLEIEHGFAKIRRTWRANDEIRLAFPIGLRTEPTINRESLPGHFTYRHGVLLLSSHLSLASKCRDGLAMTQPARYRAAGPDGIDLYPLTDGYRLPEETAALDRKKVLFR